MRRAEARPAFLVDAMLADVARWLRILGEDAAWVPPAWRDEDLVQAAVRDGRVIVTRDAALAARAARDGLGVVRVPQADPAEVLYHVYRHVGLQPEAERIATRCATCNGGLDAVDGAAAEQRAVEHAKAPPLPEVRARHEAFWSCRECGQAYWRGTHWETIMAVRERLVARLAGERGAAP